MLIEPTVRCMPHPQGQFHASSSTIILVEHNKRNTLCISNFTGQSLRDPRGNDISRFAATNRTRVLIVRVPALNAKTPLAKSLERGAPACSSPLNSKYPVVCFVPALQSMIMLTSNPGPVRRRLTLLTIASKMSSNSSKT